MGGETGAPVCASQTRPVPSSAPVETSLPSGLNLAKFISWLSVIGSPMGWPVATSQRRAVWSSEAVTTRVPSGLNSAISTASSWRNSGPSCRPVFASQRRAVWSSEAVTILLPSGLYAAPRTAPWWPRSSSRLFVRVSVSSAKVKAAAGLFAGWQRRLSASNCSASGLLPCSSNSWARRQLASPWLITRGSLWDACTSGPNTKQTVERQRTTSLGPKPFRLGAMSWVSEFRMTASADVAPICRFPLNRFASGLALAAFPDHDTDAGGNVRYRRAVRPCNLATYSSVPPRSCHILLTESGNGWCLTRCCLAGGFCRGDGPRCWEGSQRQRSRRPATEQPRGEHYLATLSDDAQPRRDFRRFASLV